MSEDAEIQSPPAGQSSLKRWARPVFGTVAVLFVAHAIKHLYTSWDGSSVDVSPGYFAAAILVAALAMIVQLHAWRSLIRHMTGTRMPPRGSAKLYLDSQMARYTPGKVGLPVVRIAGATALGISPKIMASALFVEVVSWTGVGSAVGGLVLGLSPATEQLSSLLSNSALVVGLGAIVGLLIVLVVDRESYPEKIRSMLGAEGDGPLVPWSLPALHLVHFVVWIMSGALLCLAVGGSLEIALVTGGLLCLAIIGGFLALLAPAGAGVREAVMAVGLSPLLGPSASVSVGILARVASLVSDVVLWGWFRMRATRTESDSDRI